MSQKKRHRLALMADRIVQDIGDVPELFENSIEGSLADFVCYPVVVIHVDHRAEKVQTGIQFGSVP
jgi:hypothetical protein